MATSVGESRLSSAVKANLELLQKARTKHQAVSVGLMSGRTVVKTASRWNLLLRFHNWLWNSRGATQLHNEMKQVLDDDKLDVALRRQIFKEIVSGACPVFGKMEADEVRENESSYFASARVSVVDPKENLYLGSDRTSKPEKPPSGKAHFELGRDLGDQSLTDPQPFQNDGDEIAYEPIEPVVPSDEPVPQAADVAGEPWSDFGVDAHNNRAGLDDQLYVAFEDGEARSPDESGWVGQPRVFQTQQDEPAEDGIEFELPDELPENVVPQTVHDDHVIEQNNVPEPDSGRAVFTLPDSDAVNYRPVTLDEVKPEQEAVPVYEPPEPVLYEEQSIDPGILSEPPLAEPRPVENKQRVTEAAQVPTATVDMRAVRADPTQVIAEEQRRLQEQMPKVSLSDSRAFLEAYYNLAFLDIEGIPDESAHTIKDYLQGHFLKTRQADGFEDLEMEVMLKVLNDFKASLSSLDFSGYLQTLSAWGTPNRHAMLTKIMQHIMHNGMEREESVHGHPKEQVSRDHLEFLDLVAGIDGACEALGVTLAPETEDKFSVFGLKEKLRNDTRFLTNKMRFPEFIPLSETLKTFDVQAVAQKIAAARQSGTEGKPLTHSECDQIARARKALLDIQLSHVGRRWDVSALSDPAYWDNQDHYDCYMKLQAIDTLRCEQIYDTQRQWLLQQHQSAAKHPRVVIEGAGPTGLTLGLTQFEAGANVTVLEKRSTEYDRVQIVRLDPMWMSMLKFYLGERYYELFSSDQGELGREGRGILRPDGFGEITTRYLEDALHMELSEMIALAPGGLERRAMHELTDIVEPERGGKYRLKAKVAATKPRVQGGVTEKFAERAAVSLDKVEFAGDKDKRLDKKVQSNDFHGFSESETTGYVTEEISDVDLLICAGGGGSQIVKQQLKPETVTQSRQYGVCTWENPKMNNAGLDTFADFRQVIELDKEFIRGFNAQLNQYLQPEQLSAWMEGKPEVYQELFNEFDPDNHGIASYYLEGGLTGKVMQTRCFENKGSLYIAMEIPEALETFMNDLSITMQAYKVPGNDQKQLHTFVRQAWFQAVANSYGLDRKIGATADCINRKFVTTFPVSQHRLGQNVKTLNKGEAHLRITAAGDAAASPHFMRYSGLTGARENILNIKRFTQDIAKGESKYHLDTVTTPHLERKSQKTADFVIERGRVFLPPMRPLVR